MTDKDDVARARRRRVRALKRRLRGRGARLAVVGVGLALVACVAEEAVRHDQAPERTELKGEPTIRVLLAEAAKKLTLGSTGACQVIPSPGEPLLLERLEDTPLVPAADGLGLELGTRRLTGALECRFVAGPDALVRLEG